MSLTIKGAKDYDRAVVSFTKADGTFPTPEEVDSSRLPLAGMPIACATGQWHTVPP
jgi:hypothetical protein